MPTPYGIISTSEGPVNPEEPKIEKGTEELTDEEQCPCFYGGTCPTNGEHKE